MKTVLINVDELWLRGKNRKHYFRVLRTQLNSRIQYYHPHKFTLNNENQRFVLKSHENFSRDLLTNLQCLPGLHSILPVVETSCDLALIKKITLSLMQDLIERNPGQKHTFRVTTQRTDKLLPFSSMDVSREVGGLLLSHFPEQLSVNIKRPELEVHIRLSFGNKCYITLEKLMAVGGLPLKTSGQGLTMISGGFDSPVASVMMAARGLDQTFVFFHAYPFVGEEVVDKIKKLTAQLSKYQSHCELLVVPFGHVQKKIIAHCDEKYRTNLFRWAMVQVANKIARNYRKECIVTGDSLGQVASQVLKTLHLLDQASELPILRPLIGMQKKEIIKRSYEYGLHDISCLPHDDACSLLAPKNPIIKPDIFLWNKTVELLKEELKDEIENAAKDLRSFYYTPWGTEVEQ